MPTKVTVDSRAPAGDVVEPATARFNTAEEYPDTRALKVPGENEIHMTRFVLIGVVIMD